MCKFRILQLGVSCTSAFLFTHKYVQNCQCNDIRCKFLFSRLHHKTVTRSQFRHLRAVFVCDEQYNTFFLCLFSFRPVSVCLTFASLLPVSNVSVKKAQTLLIRLSKYYRLSSIMHCHYYCKAWKHWHSKISVERTRRWRDRGESFSFLSGFHAHRLPPGNIVIGP